MDPSPLGRRPRPASRPPAESNHILFSVRPPLAPLLRCELRCLRDLLRASASFSAVDLTHNR